MKILFVYPQFPDTFWSFRHALKFISKKAAIPPLGLITVSAMLPEHWEKRLVDMNVSSLKSNDIQWADYVFISAMYVHKRSVDYIISECIKHDVKMVAGGPLFTQEYELYPQIDHFVLNEAEITLPLFLEDLEKGKIPDKIYTSEGFAEMVDSPVPDYHLLSMKDYASMNLQISRGCPYACDFCEITSLLGHKVRMKTVDQLINELNEIYRLKWRGSITIVDDNFIGRKKIIKNKFLPAIKEWMEEHQYPFNFNVQASINLADDETLLSLMPESGFDSAFIGIETPDEESLQDCHKNQNRNRDLLQSIQKIQKSGIQVTAGFIVGFDKDTPSIFHRQVEFIQQSGIISAMVGLLNAPKNTKLYKRLKSENRLIKEASGNNTDLSMNFIPRMNYQDIVSGYQDLIKNIYSVKPYYQRIRQNLKVLSLENKGFKKLKFTDLKAAFKSIFIIGIFNKGRREFWKLIWWTLRYRPALLSKSLTYAIYGYHFRTIYGLRKKKIFSVE